jgi:predicted  nucleic acid-binding Zn-ribbon protein
MNSFSNFKYILCTLVLLMTSIQCQNFMGGFISWSPVNTTANSSSTNVNLVTRFFYTSDSVTCSTPSDISSSNLIGIPGNTVNAISGDTWSVSDLTPCYDYSVVNGWSGGKDTQIITATTTQLITASYTSCCYLPIYNAASTTWDLEVTMNLQLRNDTGEINSSPTLADSFVPMITFTASCTLPSFYMMPVTDADGDVIRCRCPNNVCATGLILNSDACSFYFNATTAGYYLIAIQVEDFTDISSVTPLSSVPVNIVVMVNNDSMSNGTDHCYSSISFDYSASDINDTLYGIIYDFDANMTSMYNNLNSQIQGVDQSLTSQITGTNSSINTLNQTMTEENVSLTSQVVGINSTIDSLNQTLTNKVVDTMATIDSLNQTITSNLSSINFTVGELGVNINDLNQTLIYDISNLENQVSGTNATIDSQSGEIVNINANIDSLNQTFSSDNIILTSEVVGINSTIDNLNQTLTSNVNSLNTTLSQLNQTVLSDYFDIESQIGGVNATLVDFATQIGGINSTLNTASQTLSADINNVSTNLNTQISQVGQSLNNLDRRLASQVNLQNKRVAQVYTAQGDAINSILTRINSISSIAQVADKVLKQFNSYSSG